MKRLMLPLVAGLLHAFCMWLAFAPNEFWPAALVAIVPLAWIATRGPASSRIDWRLAIAVSLGASPFYWYQQQWVYEISAAGYVPLVLYLTIYPGLFAYCLSRLHRRFPRFPLALLVPIAWTGLEWLRGEVVWDGYAWFLVAHPLIDSRFLSASGAIIGAYGVGVFIASFAGVAFDLKNVIAEATRSKNTAKLRLRDVAWIRAGIGMVVVPLFALLNLLAWVIVFTKVPEPDIRVGLIQTNIPQSNKIGWSFEQRRVDFARFIELTRQAAAKKAELIVWPETMFPGDFLQQFDELGADGKVRDRRDNSFAAYLAKVQGSLEIPMLIGALGTENLRLVTESDGARFKFDRRFNSVFLLEHGAVQPLRYDKVRLTPFGETMPYISAWPWLQDKLLAVGASGMSFDLAVGKPDRIGAFEFPLKPTKPDEKRRQFVRVVTPICFEITESSLCRKLVKQASQGGARVLIANVTNDGWFGSFDPARSEHQLAARWRSLELGVAVVRAANTGISSITEFGPGIVNRLINVDGKSARVEGILVNDVSLARGGTLFLRIGDLCWVFPLALGGMLILAFRRQTPNKLTA